jgi:hypothetical protein
VSFNKWNSYDIEAFWMLIHAHDHVWGAEEHFSLTVRIRACDVLWNRAMLIAIKCGSPKEILQPKENF